MSSKGIEVFEFNIPENIDTSITHIVINFNVLDFYDMTKEFVLKIQSDDAK